MIIFLEIFEGFVKFWPCRFGLFCQDFTNTVQLRIEFFCDFAFFICLFNQKQQLVNMHQLDFFFWESIHGFLDAIHRDCMIHQVINKQRSIWTGIDKVLHGLVHITPSMYGFTAKDVRFTAGNIMFFKCRLAHAAHIANAIGKILTQQWGKFWQVYLLPPIAVVPVGHVNRCQATFFHIVLGQAQELLRIGMQMGVSVCSTGGAGNKVIVWLHVLQIILHSPRHKVICHGQKAPVVFKTSMQGIGPIRIDKT